MFYENIIKTKMNVVIYLLKYQPLIIKQLLFLLKTFSKGLKYVYITNYELELNITHTHLKNTLYYLKHLTYFKYESISDIIGIDNFITKYRFKIIYNLLSIQNVNRLRLSVNIDEKTPLQSITQLYCSTSWQERELWDLFGILFANHSDLRRILTDYGFLGHPLRKDFPLTGFIEVYYHDNYKYVGLKPVSLAQDLRKFYEIANPWK